MKTTYIDKQADFEKQVANLKGFTQISQRKDTEQMIIDNLIDEDLMLSGTVGVKIKKDFLHEFLLISTKDSEVNHIESISLKMVREIIRSYSSVDAKTKKRSKITFLSNIPLDIHSTKAAELKRKYNFHFENIGYLFCEKNNLEYTEMY